MSDSAAALAAWLRRLEALDPTRIELGLDRVRPVARALGLNAGRVPVITVAGTNGKGSTVAFADAIACAAGLRVGAYLSPHVQRFNERVRINGVDADDVAIVAALEAVEAVEAARSDTPLTYFEFTSLAALWLFGQHDLDVWVLEVGLGGRLDVVNVIDADVAVITTIGLDHQDWLGDSRDAIALEKAGILRSGKPVVCGEPDCPASLAKVLGDHDAPVWQLGRDIVVEQGAGARWALTVGQTRWDDLPPPALSGTVMRGNAALAGCALQAAGLPVDQTAFADALARVRLPGRLQPLGHAPVVWLDTAHNPQAAAALAQSIAGMPVVPVTHVVLGMLADKDVASVVNTFGVLLGARTRLAWVFAGLPGPRGLSGEDLAARSGLAGRVFDTVTDALAHACRAAGPQGRVVCFGSFLTVEAALADAGVTHV